MDGKTLVDYKKKYDAIAYLPYQDSTRIYYRAPSISEYITITANTVSIKDKFDCIQTCVFAITDIDGKNEKNIDEFLDDIYNKSPGFIENLVNAIMLLSPLSDKDKAISVYKNIKDSQALLINTVKTEIINTFKDYRLAEDIDNFSYKKFMKYVVMMEEMRNTQGLFISDLVGDESLLEDHVKEKLMELQQMQDKQNKQNKAQPKSFPKNLHTIDSADPRIKDDSIRTAISQAQLALRAKLQQDKINQERGVSSYVDFDQDNKTAGAI